MKNFLVAALLGISSILTGCSAIAEYTWPAFSGSTEQRQDVFPRNYVIFLKIGDSGNCSGVIIGQDTVLTAAHCAAGEQISVGDVPAKVIKIDPSIDLALLTVPGVSCPCAPISVKDLQVDSPIATIGFPLGGPQIVTEGRIQAIWFEMVPYVEIITSPITFGNSGGGVFQIQDGRWVLVGIVSAVANAPLNPFFSTPISHLGLAVRGDVIGQFLK